MWLLPPIQHSFCSTLQKRFSDSKERTTCWSLKSFSSDKLWVQIEAASFKCCNRFYEKSYCFGSVFVCDTPPPLGAQEVGPSAPYHDQPRALCAGAGQHNEPLLWTWLVKRYLVTQTRLGLCCGYSEGGGGLRKEPQPMSIPSYVHKTQKGTDCVPQLWKCGMLVVVLDLDEVASILFSPLLLSLHHYSDQIDFKCVLLCWLNTHPCFVIQGNLLILMLMGTFTSLPSSWRPSSGNSLSLCWPLTPMMISLASPVSNSCDSAVISILRHPIKTTPKLSPCEFSCSMGHSNIPSCIQMHLCNYGGRNLLLS